MSSNPVYRVLREVFPQVDTRVLRAVAIEHPEDCDTAVEAVLNEVIPYLSKKAPVSDPRYLNSVAVAAACCSDCRDDALQADSMYSVEPAQILDGSSYGNANGSGDQVCGYDGNDELISFGIGGHVTSHVGAGPDVVPHVTLITVGHQSSADNDCSLHGNYEREQEVSLQGLSSVKVSHVPLTTPTYPFELSNRGDSKVPSACDADMFIHGESCQDLLCSDVNQTEAEKFLLELAETPVEKNSTPNKDASSGDTVEFDDEFSLNSLLTQSRQICSADLLEDSIEDAGNNKKTLFSAMESVISFMKMVELEEEAAAQAKEEAARGGLDIHTRMEDLKQMLQHAKEANDMHAGEVYGEKAILATEVRELQSRLLNLSDERNKSLAILDEMREALEERMEAAKKVRKAAEQEKMKKEESARSALAEQELIMEKVVQESKILKQEAEENSKLREFLVDRGGFVDILQGEISVICKDVILLKENFDQRAPLSKSLSSSQTSCILASSSSSLKSVAPDQFPKNAQSSIAPNQLSPGSSIADQLSLGEEREGDDRKVLVDDGWDFLDPLAN